MTTIHTTGCASGAAPAHHDEEVVSVADRLRAATAQRVADSGDDLDLWPIEFDPFEEAKREMMLQPFIEMLFYGEEEETGNVQLSTML